MTRTAFLRGVAVPFGILFLAFAVLFFAGQAGSLGPLDAATYQWIILGLWIASPVAGGLAVRALDDRQVTIAAAVLGVVLGLVVAAFFLTAAGTGTYCEVGFGRSVAGFVSGCLGVGAIVGAGTAASELVAARLARRGRRLLAVLLGGGLSLAAIGGGLFTFYSIVRCLT